MAAVVALLVALVLAGCRHDATEEAAPPTATVPTTAPAAPPEVGENGIPDLVEAVQASVVAVIREGGEGSGVIWGPSTIVTNHHVIVGASTVEVALVTGERLEARVRASDELSDLAVLEVERDDLPAATFRRDLPRVGELALAMGNPLGFEHSVTLGIVSGLHRSIPSGGQTPALVDLIQTDAAISPGNSGGGLFGANGEVIGINVAYIPPVQRAVALGFAIPSPTVIDVVEQLLENGTVRHAFMGVRPAPLDPVSAQRLGVDVEGGVLVLEVVPGSGAEAAGIQPGDAIVRIGETEIEAVEDLFAELRRRTPGEDVAVVVVREGEERTLRVRLGDHPGA